MCCAALEKYLRIKVPNKLIRISPGLHDQQRATDQHGINVFVPMATCTLITRNNLLHLTWEEGGGNKQTNNTLKD
jgi:hypothetical protein